ncbi:MAG: RMD1 family protein [bacterium]|nr:RMD1 family protein [bacterium]
MIVKSIKVGEKIRLKELSRELKITSILSDFFIFKEGAGIVTILKFGVIVFWGFSDKKIDSFIKKIGSFVDEATSKDCAEEINVFTSKNKDSISSSGILLKDLDSRRVAIVSEVLGRSVALDSYECEIEEMMKNFGNITNILCSTGKIFLSNKKLFKLVGFAMNTQHRVISKLTVLDKPSITWDSADIDEFYGSLAHEYEIQHRYEILKQKIEMIFRDIEFIMNYMDSKKSHFLEGIIILLILIEIVLFLPDFLN